MSSMNDVINKYHYCQYAKGFSAKRQILSIDAIPNDDTPIDYCTTYFSYTKDLFEYWMKNKKTSGYAGESFCRYVPIDIDSDNLAKAKKTTLTIINQLKYAFDVDIDCVRIFFSGSKGFHLELPYSLFGIEPCTNLPYRLKKTMQKLGFDVDMSMYQHNRLWRLPNTINSKTNLYKIQLKYRDLDKSIDDIKSMAEKPSDVFDTYDEYCDTNDTLHSIYKNTEYTKEYFTKTTSPKPTLPPSTKVPLPQGVPRDIRNKYLLKYGLQWRSQGIPLERALELALRWNNSCKPPEAKYKVKATIKHLYDNPKEMKPKGATAMKWFLRNDEWLNSLSPSWYRVVSKFILSLNEEIKSQQGISIKPNQRLYSQQKLAFACQVERGIVRRCVERMVELGYALNEKVYNYQNKPRFLLTWLVFDVTEK